MAFNQFAQALTSAPSGGGGLPRFLFGNGIDGSIVATTTKLTADVYATTYTVPNGVTVNCGNYRIYATTSITVEGGGVIHSNGQNQAQTRVDTQTVGFYGRGAFPPSNGGYNAGNNGTNGAIFGGAGGDGGTGNAGANLGGTGGTIQAVTGAAGYPWSLPVLLSGRTNDTNTQYGAAASGGNGGGGATLPGGVGGVGGEGAGIVFLCAPLIINDGTISANGGNGGNGEPATTAAGGGGGGGGGTVIIIAGSFTGNTPTVLGGAGGIGTGTGTNGTAGFDGNLISYIGAV